MSIIASELRMRTVNGEYPDESRHCDLCSDVASAPASQVCDHRCVCGRALQCEHGERRVSVQMWHALALAAADSALWAIERGSEDEAGLYAKDCVSYCRKYQLAGGHPAGRL